MNKASAFSDRSIQICLAACLLGFGGFILWASFAELDEGVTASGQIVVEDNRKRVQHLEGGIISTLHVSEGDVVNKNDILVELAPLQSESARDELAQELAVQTANIIRLTTLREEVGELDFTPLEEIEINPAIRQEIIDRQQALYDQQRTARAAELSVLESRRSALQSRKQDLTSQINATSRSLSTAREDLALRRELLEERLEVISNVNTAERQVTELEAEMSRLRGERNQATKSDQEIAYQMSEARARFQERIGEQLVEAQTQALAARERLLAQDDRLARTIVRAPQAGTVLNLAHSTLGGVVGAGETILEIVPSNDELIVNLRLNPTDRDAVQPGQIVEAQLSAYKSFKAPRLDGEVLGVSADLKQDEVSGTYYYEARVRLDASEIAPDIQIIPGMPVDAFIASGNRRTFFDYVMEPIWTTIRRGTQMS